MNHLNSPVNAAGEPRCDMEQPAQSEDSNPSAVSKVFSLPELVEHILMCLAESSIDAHKEDDDDSDWRTVSDSDDSSEDSSEDDSDYDSEGDSGGDSDLDSDNCSVDFFFADSDDVSDCDPEDVEHMQPLTCLAAVPRVNALFYDTVKKSQQLQKPLERPAHIEIDTWIAPTVKWLLNGMMGMWTDDLSMFLELDEDHAYEFAIEEMRTWNKGDRARFQQFYKDNKTASWRRFKLLGEVDRVKGGKDLTLLLRFDAVEYEASAEEISSYRSKLRFRDDVTLLGCHMQNHDAASSEATALTSPQALRTH